MKRLLLNAVVYCLIGSMLIAGLAESPEPEAPYIESEGVVSGIVGMPSEETDSQEAAPMAEAEVQEVEFNLAPPDAEAVEEMTDEAFPDAIPEEEAPSEPEELPTVVDVEPVEAAEEAVEAEEEPSDPEEAPVVAEEAPVEEEEEPAEPEETPAVVEETPVEAEEEPAEPEETPAVAEEDPVEEEEEPAEPEETPGVVEETPVEAEEEPAEPEETPAVAEEDPVEEEEEPAEPEETPAVAEEDPVEAEEEPAEPEDAPTVAEEEPVEAGEVPLELEEAPIEVEADIEPEVPVEVETDLEYEEALPVEEALLLDEETFAVEANASSSADFEISGTTLTKYVGSGGAVVVPIGITVIGMEAFSGCTGVTSVTVPSGVTEIGSMAFYGCKGLTSVTLPGSLKYILGNAFTGCSSLKRLDLPDNLSTIQDGAFYDTPVHVYAKIGSDTAKLSKNSGFSFWMDGSPCSLQYTDTGLALTGVESGLTSLTIPSGVTEFGSYAFLNSASTLASLTIPSSVTQLDSGTFATCYVLKSITLPNSITEIGDSLFQNCSALENVVIPSSVTSIGYKAFDGCSALARLDIPNSVVSINEFAFDNCPVRLYASFGGKAAEAICAAHLNYWLDGKDIALTRDLEGLEVVEADSAITSVSVPAGVETIRSNAFKRCLTLSSLTLPEGLKKIGSSAFCDCDKLKRLVLPSSVNTLYSDTFKNCSARVYAPFDSDAARAMSNLYINFWNEGMECAFLYTDSGLAITDSDKALKSVSIPTGVAIIGSDAFKGSQLTSVTIPSTVKEIGYSAFYNCDGLKKITLPKGVTTIDSSAFQDCSNLSTVSIPSSVTSIGFWAFEGCTSLKSLTLPASVTSIENSAFATYASTALHVPCSSYAETYAKAHAEEDGFTVSTDHNFDDNGVCKRCGEKRYVKCTAVGEETVYDGQPHTLTLIVTEPAGSAVPRFGTKAYACDQVNSPTFTKAGTWTIYYSVTAKGYAKVTGSVMVKIKPLTVGLSWSGTSLTYNGKQQAPKVKLTGLVSGDSCNVTVTGAQTNAGSYTAKASALDNANYALPASNKQAFTIAKRVATLEWKDTEVVYNGKKQIPTAKVTNLCSGDTCLVTVDKEHLNAGKYTVTAKSLSNKNYKLPKENTKSFFIKRKPIELKWTKTSTTYNGTKQFPEVKIKGLVGSDTCEPVFDKGGKRAGTYMIKLKGFTNPNYKVPTDNTVKFTIKKAPVKLSWANLTVTYNGKSRVPTATVKGLVAGDICTVTVDKAHKNAGTYTVTASKLSNGNYALPAKNTATFTIKPKTVQLTWKKTSFKYDGKSHAPTAVATGLAAGDTCTVTVTGAKKAVGSYTATASKLSNKNYALPKANTKKFTIVK